MRSVALVLVLVLAVAGATAACVSSGERADIDDDTIEVFGPYRGADADRFAEALAAFEARSGVDVRYIGSVDFVADLVRRSGEGNDPPDVAMVPQPGLIRRLADAGQIVPLGPSVQDAVTEHYTPEGAALGTIDGTLYAVPFRLVVKSLVWYRPDVFASRGWSVPSTLEDLEALVDEIEASGAMAPWCFGIEAGSATGWAATDWVEDLVLRGVGPERYGEWAAGEVGFTDPAIADAFTEFRSLVLDPGRAMGELAGVLDTPVDEAVAPMFADPVGCALYKQADFAVGWMPSGTTIGADGDVDFFVLPEAEGSGPAPLVVGGDQAVQFRYDPAVDELMRYLATPVPAEAWARAGGFLSPNRSVSENAYPVSYLRALADVLADPPALVFDASDQMPPEIGSSLLWSAITDWVAGVYDYRAFAAEVDGARADVAEPAGTAS